MSFQKIMLVDDEAITVMINEKQFKVYDDTLQVSGFTSPLAAIDYLERSRPDVIFLDIRMPLMDGFEFLEVMKEKDIPVPVILLTSSSSNYDMEKIRQYSNVIHYLTKPLTVEKIGRLIAGRG